MCGYRYGTRWLLEEVPCGVLEWLNSLSDVTAETWVGEIVVNCYITGNVNN